MKHELMFQGGKLHNINTFFLNGFKANARFVKK